MQQKYFMYEKIYKDLRERILSGEYMAGTRLPSEKELEETYHVSRITSKKAMDMLAMEGLIHRVRGSGSYVDRHTSLPMEEKIAREAHISEEKVLTEFSSEKDSSISRKLIGVILDNFNDNFGAGILKGIEYECSRRGYNMMLRCTYGNYEVENEAIHQAIDQKIAGLILIPAQNETYNTNILKLSLQQFPIVLADRAMSGLRIPCVTTDNYRAAQELTDLLLMNGHKNICFLTHSLNATSTIYERYQGFADRMIGYEGGKAKRATISNFHPTPTENLMLFSEESCEEMRQIILENEDCTAFLTIEYRLAFLLCKILDKMKVKKTVVSFDALPREYSWMGLGYARQGEHEIGIRTVEILSDLIAGKRVQGTIYVPYEMIYEENTK